MKLNKYDEVTVRVRPVNPTQYVVEYQSGQWSVWSAHGVEDDAKAEAIKAKEALQKMIDKDIANKKFVEENPPYEV